MNPCRALTLINFIFVFERRKRKDVAWCWLRSGEAKRGRRGEFLQGVHKVLIQFQLHFSSICSLRIESGLQVGKQERCWGSRTDMSAGMTESFLKMSRFQRGIACRRASLPLLHSSRWRRPLCSAQCRVKNKNSLYIYFFNIRNIVFCGK